MGRMARSPEGLKLINILQKRQKVYDYDCRRLDSSALHRVQGRTLELEDLLALFENAKEKLTKDAAQLSKRIIKDLRNE